MAPDEPLLDARVKALDERIARARQHLPAAGEEPQPPSPAPLPGRCPVCGTEMESGRVSVHGTFWGFLLVGLSYQHCWFEPSGGGDELPVIQSGLGRRACRCARCGFIGIDGRGEAEPTRRGIGDV